MLTSTKKFIPLLLLIIISYQTIGVYIFYIGWKLYMHEKVEKYAATLPNNKLIKITQQYNGNPLVEFEQNNKMYDVIRYEIKGSIIHYFCINDSDEEQINKQSEQDKTLQNIKTKGSTKAKNIIKKMCQQTIGLLSAFTLYNSLYYTEIFNVCCFYKTINHPKNAINPPPQFV